MVRFRWESVSAPPLTETNLVPDAGRYLAGDSGADMSERLQLMGKFGRFDCRVVLAGGSGKLGLIGRGGIFCQDCLVV